MAKIKGNRKLAMLFILLSIGWIAMLFTESSQPPAPIMGEVPGLDKLAHFVAFGVLAFFLCVVTFCITDKPSVPLFSMPLLVSTLSGILEEGYQMTVPGRTGSLLDLTANLCGAVFVIFLVNIYCIKHSSR